jgi:hypothetical protein
VGEVLTEKQIADRLTRHEKLKPNDPNFYIMALETGWYIDARDKGNLSRFINHSCAPNCQLQRVNVAGCTRIAIVCIKPVEPGEFLSYDYQFDTEHAEKFRCACGAENCRGTMKGGDTSLMKKEEEKKTKAQMLKEAKGKLERDKKFVEKVEEESVSRLNLVGRVVPGGNSEAELILNGPRKMCVRRTKRSERASSKGSVGGRGGGATRRCLMRRPTRPSERKQASEGSVEKWAKGERVQRGGVCCGAQPDLAGGRGGLGGLPPTARCSARFCRRRTATSAARARSPTRDG